MVVNPNGMENLTYNQSNLGKLELIDVAHRILFFQGRPGI